MLKQEIKSIFDFHKKRYGSLRIVSELKDKGYQVGIHRVRTLMKEQGLIALQPKSYVPITTQSHPNRRRSPNLLLKPLNWADGPNQVIVGDITYLPSQTKAGYKWLYLATWMDFFSRKIVGWCVEESMEESIIIKAFGKVLKSRKIQSGLIVHSDGGSQYSGHNFRGILASHHFRQSMTRKDNHYDNAEMESFFGRFKTEVLSEGIFTGLENARFRVFEFIDGYYNTIRKHSWCEQRSPDQYEQAYWDQQDK